MREYKLYNRYNTDVRLIKVADNKFLFVIPENEMDWIRYGTDPENNDEIYMVDPSGGPYISVGDMNTLYVVDDEKVKAISFVPEKIEFARNEDFKKSSIYIHFKDLNEICQPRKN